jgi:plastocyanin
MALVDRRGSVRTALTAGLIPLILLAAFATVYVARAATASVNIQNIAFNPASITVNAGDTVNWTNNDSVAHTVTSDTSGVFNMSSAPGSTVSFTFNTPGTFAYHCNIHPNMHGTVVVLAAASAGSTSTSGATATSAAPNTGSGSAPGGSNSTAPIFIVVGAAFVAISLSAGLVFGQAVARKR